VSRPRLLDLFCGGGGAGAGYAAAGFDVVGVDLSPQPRYPFEFVQADALEYLAAEGASFDAVHASPPCQRYSSLTRRHGAGAVAGHPDLVAPTRELLELVGRPWVIENVPGAPLRSPVLLCGSMFGLAGTVAGERRQLRRHRLFESPVFLYPPGPCSHDGGRTIGVYGHPGGKSKRDRVRFGGSDSWREAMGIDWLRVPELAEAIPPAYTEWLGRLLLGVLP
jgi:DNA (cytosine-5)-methyltransferase 1